MRVQKRFLFLLAGAALLWGSARSAQAGPQTQAGPYHVEVITDPAVIPVGQPVKLMLKISDAAGKPIEEAQVRVIAQMSGMPMGEREEAALPQPGQPGVYVAPARFGMKGDYTATLHLAGPQGAATANVPLRTGQNTAASATGRGISLLAWLPWLAGIALVVFVLYRMRRTGQRVRLRPLLNGRTLLGVGLLAAVCLASYWAVHRYTKPGHMSVIEAQSMDMTVMKPPLGAIPVAAMAAKREPIDATVRYSGSAVPYVDQDVAPRVPGILVWMPLYPGQTVRRGQTLARLDARELASRVNEQAANVQIAEHAVDIARRQYQQALGARAQASAQVEEAQSDVVSARSELAAAQQDVTAAQEERASAQADLDGAQTGAADAQAQLAAALADQTYWSAQIRRSRELLSGGAISQQEFQQDQAQAENANAKVRQARARVQQADAAIRAAQARIKRAAALIAGTQAKVGEMQAKLQGSRSKVAQAEANAHAMSATADAAQHEIEHARAGVRQAQAQWNTARVVAGYTEIYADLDGVVTQRLLSPGVLVQPGQAILKVAQIRPIRLQANVAQSDLPDIQTGSRVRVTTARDPQHPVEARVTSVFPAADPASRTAIVEAVVPNADRRFLPGDFLTMEITTGENRRALVVPSGAIVYQPKATSAVLATDQTPAVWVLTAEQPEKTVYTCTMHPEVQQDRPGKCPI
jgi:RND family efflux transporter MFP subunit